MLETGESQILAYLSSRNPTKTKQTETPPSVVLPPSGAMKTPAARQYQSGHQDATSVTGIALRSSIICLVLYSLERG